MCWARQSCYPGGDATGGAPGQGGSRAGAYGRVLSPWGLSVTAARCAGRVARVAVSCVLWEGHSYHGPMSCCVLEPSGDGTWEPDVVPSGGVATRLQLQLIWISCLETLTCGQVAPRPVVESE